ncbi:hypothetical protein F5Y01DRAFT_329331 [Xylaria sp. FL0043]|nr:hypothetical protein F5Y01DRAFT_329331 [Xylaria sp. FL0043]
MCAEALTKPLYFDKIAEGKLSFLNVRKQDLLEWAIRDESVLDQLNRKSCLPHNSKLDIVGMACRMPGGANNPQQFWEFLMDGKDTHTVVPPDRFDVEAHFDPTGKTENAIGTRFGNFRDNPAEQTDPMQRLALITAYEALEMAGLVPGRTPSSHLSRVGTYYGQASDDYREVNASQRIGTYGTPGTGPSLNVDTACSSGLAAVHEACAALWAGEADTVVAGDLNIITNPDIYCMLTKGHFLSTTGQCKVWDAEADGYCRGDGVGFVVIKRLEDALTDNDNILATISSGNTNHSAESASITQPHVGAQVANYRRVMDKVSISPCDVSFVKLHGTGTQVGDAVESESVLGFFAPTGRRLRPEQRLYLGAVKSNVGHGVTAAGIASLIKVLLMYHHGKIQRHVGIKTGLNPVVTPHLANRNVGVVFENTPWLPVSPGARRYSVANSFGAHGDNTTLLLEDAPSPRSQINGNLKQGSLRGNVDVLIRYLDAHPEIDLADLAYTTCARRIHHHIRIAFSVTSTTQLRRSLQAAANDLDAHARPVSSTKQRAVVFAFSGQGCLSQGAAARLLEQAPDFPEQVLQLDRIVRELGFPSVLAAISGDVAPADGAASPTSSTNSSVIGESGTETIISLESDRTSTAEEEAESIIVALTHVLIGHSLGEYAAFVTAGVLSAADALYLVGRRAKLMLATCYVGSHAMLSVRGASAARITELCRASNSDYPYEVSCLNGLEDTVVNVGLRAALLDTLFAFHSAQMEPLLNDFEQAARRVTFKDPSIPVVSPLLGQCVSRGSLINETYLRRATREPVDFVAALDAAMTDGVVDTNSTWIDIGPHPVCTSFVRPTLTETLATLHCQGYEVRWNEYFAHETSYRLLELDSYQWNNKNYWIPYEGTRTLDKARTQRGATDSKGTITPLFLTSSVQQIVSEEFGKSMGHVAALSNLTHSDLAGSADAHRINGRSIVTGSTWADIMFAMGDYLFTRMFPNGATPHMNTHNMEVAEAQVMPEEESPFPSLPAAQFILIDGVLDVSQNKTQMNLYTAQNGETRRLERKEFASATVCYEDLQIWQAASHLVAARAEALWKAAIGMGDSSDSNRVNRLACSATYRLFANVVECGPRYRGMQRVALAEDSQEATSEVILDVDRDGTWHTPSHWIDSVFQLAGFVMNAPGVVNGDEPVETESCHDFFYITPGWRSLRLAEPSTEQGVWIGDIFLLCGEKIVGVCAGIKFKRIPRSLMPVMFPRCKQLAQKTVLQGRSHDKPVAEINIGGNHTQSQPLPNLVPTTRECVQFHAPASYIAHTSREDNQADVMQQALFTPDAPMVAATREIYPAYDGGGNARVASCLQLIAEETGLNPEDLTGEAAFTDLGGNPLMSLALAGKIQCVWD